MPPFLFLLQWKLAILALITIPLTVALTTLSARIMRKYWKLSAEAYADLGGRGACIAMHWGTFRLTDEDPLEPPRRARRAWSALGLEPGDLYVPRHGETVRV